MCHIHSHTRTHTHWLFPFTPFFPFPLFLLFFLFMILLSSVPYRWRYIIGFVIFSLVVLQSWFITHPHHPPGHNELSVPTNDDQTPPMPSNGFASKLPTIQHPNVMTEPDPRREAIVDAFRHAWAGYSEFFLYRYSRIEANMDL